MTTFRVALVLLLGALAAMGCRDAMKTKASEEAIAHFHEQYNASGTDGIWSEADEKPRNATSRQTFDALIGAMHTKLGNVVSTSNAGRRTGNFNLTTTVSMTRKTTFEKGEDTESFAFQIEKGKSVLVGYNIQSMDLITK
jgi:hypothetical protein